MNIEIPDSYIHKKKAGLTGFNFCFAFFFQTF